MAGSRIPFTPDEALTDFLRAVAAPTDLRPFTARLFLGPPALVPSLTAAGMLEASYAGYAAQTFSWAAPAPGVSGPTLTGTAALTFSATGPSTPGSQDVAGWYVTNGLGHLVTVFLYPDTIDFSVTGATTVFTPVLPTGRGC